MFRADSIENLTLTFRILRFGDQIPLVLQVHVQQKALELREPGRVPTAASSAFKSALPALSGPTAADTVDYGDRANSDGSVGWDTESTAASGELFLCLFKLLQWVEHGDADAAGSTTARSDGGGGGTAVATAGTCMAYDNG